MRLPFLDRAEETARIRRLLARTEGSLDRRPLEIDLVAESDGGEALLIGEAKWTAPPNPASALAELERKAERLPLATGRRLYTALWIKTTGRGPGIGRVVNARRVLHALR